MTLDPGLAVRVRAQARRLGVSVATLFHAAWALVVSQTTGRDDVVFGSVLLGRLQGSAGSQHVIGMFINTLPLRLPLGKVSARELVERAHQELMELLTHEQASLAMAQRCSGLVGSSPLFTSLLNYRHGATDRESELQSTAGITFIEGRSWTNYPVMLSVDEMEEGFSLTADTDIRVDPRRVTEYLHTVMQSLVDALEQDSQAPVMSLTLMPESERRQVLERFNATEAHYPLGKLIHELVEEQAERTPEAVAVGFSDRCVSYAQLNERASRLARRLRESGVGPDVPVGVFLERGVEMVVGVLGILKAGGAYVPLDPSYPIERLQYMLEDARPPVVLTQEGLRGILPPTPAEVISLDAKPEMLGRYSG
jgi:non-ribosomal peptide synthetase component F